MKLFWRRSWSDSQGSTAIAGASFSRSRSRRPRRASRTVSMLRAQASRMSLLNTASNSPLPRSRAACDCGSAATRRVSERPGSSLSMRFSAWVGSKGIRKVPVGLSPVGASMTRARYPPSPSVSTGGRSCRIPQAAMSHLPAWFPRLRVPQAAAEYWCHGLETGIGPTYVPKSVSAARSATATNGAITRPGRSDCSRCGRTPRPAARSAVPYP